MQKSLKNWTVNLLTIGAIFSCSSCTTRDKEMWLSIAKSAGAAAIGAGAETYATYPRPQPVEVTSAK